MKQIFVPDSTSIKKIDLKKLHSSKYLKLVNNLLDIKSRGDNATFFKTSNLSLDLKKLIGIKNLRYIFKNQNFKISLKNSFDSKTLQELKHIRNVDNFIQWAKEYDYSISPKMHDNLNLNPDRWLPIYKNKIIDQNSDFIKTWKTNAKRVEEIYAETSIWPLFIGTLFIRYRKDDVYLYAPFILKSAKITFSGNSVYLENADQNIIINEKIKYLIEQHSDNKLPILVNGEEITISEALESIKNIKELNFTNEYDENIFFESLIECSKNDFQNDGSFELLPGTTLFEVNPGGTKLRKAMINLILADKIDNLIRIDDLRDYSKEAYEKALEKSNIARVTASDFSQEKAIVGTLNNSSIIIGPPGTGKSQTIANILINIAKNNKKALFISQKKVALDVVLKRLNKYQNMMFQFSESAKINQTEKEYFYKPIIEYFKQINVAYKYNDLNNYNSSFFSKNEFNYLNAKSELGEIFSRDLKAYNGIKNRGMVVQNINNFAHFYKLYNKMESKNDFLKIFKNYKKVSRRKIAMELGYLKPNASIFKSPSLKFIRIYNNAKNAIKFYNAKLSRYDIEDLVQLSNFIRLNSFIEFDDKEKDYTKYWDFKKLDNTTPEMLEMIYENSAYLAKERLDSYRQNGEKERQKLNRFLGRLERKITPPYIITSLFSDIIKRVYNIYVGTPEILGNFVDFEKDHFDYVIFDEASQIYIEKAIPFISIADKVIVAGDSQQMQPSNWFSTRDETEDEYSDEEITSLLDWAINNHLPKYVLEMNYRSNSSELVLFSSKEFYDSSLKGLDSYGKKEKTSVEVVDVDGEWIDNKNEIECAKMISICEKNLKKYNSIILLAFNRKQQDYIREQIALLSPKIFEVLEDKVILRNIENIQGDEAELVIASVGYTSKTSLHSTYIGSKKGRNALNVAITRAKDKMIVIKSIKTNEIDPKNENLMTFKRWLNYIQLKSDKQKLYISDSINTNNNDRSDKTQFIFEIQAWLNEQSFANDIKIELNYCVGSYNIDMAILDNRNNFIVGLNIDDSSNDVDLDTFIQKRIKTDFMSVKGYPIYRISSFRFNDNKPSMFKFINTLINK
ncbi:ATP-binding protein [Metamycoplasma phocicerebrale]|uniref:ATP-binding protein n=1 Tax=Metamycoplasma phocicerebrale TaxID=142649 RepID=A0A3Q9V355_9BACT|nr:DEAD/DEAH box helicase [Metamycoplasma phocicerebrale]AZZ65542.1 ATP-binding protein [Metamycoplasma phocicerebrale]